MAHVIDAVIHLRDQFSATLRNVTGNLTAFQRQANVMSRNMIAVGKSVEKVGKSLVVGVTLPIVGMAAASAKAATSFQHEMADIRKEVDATGITTTQTNSLMAEMSKSSLKWSQDFGQSTETINEGLLVLVKDGYTAGEAMSIMGTSLLTARGANEDLATVVDQLGSSLEAYGMKTNDAAKTTQNMAHMADAFAYIANHTKASITSLGSAFSTAGSTAAALHIPMTQTAAAIGILESNGVDAETAATSLKSGLVNLAKPTKKMQTALKEMGFSAFDSKGNMKDLGTTLNEIEKKTEGYTNQQKQAAIATIFGKESLASWNILLHKGGGYLTTLADNANGAAGEVQKLSDAMKDTAQNKFKELEESVHALGVVFGAYILPSIIPLVNKLSELIQGFAAMDEETKKAIVKYAMYAAAVGPVILMVGKITRTIGDAFKRFSELSLAISRAGGALNYLKSPGVIVVIVLLALVAAAVLVATHWDLVKKKFNDFKKVLKDNEVAIRNVAIALGVVFGPALIALGAQAVLTGGQIVVGLIASIISTGVQAAITASIFTGKMIVSLVSFALQAWKTVAVITFQTALFVAQRLGIISASEATSIITAAQWLFNAAMDANPIGVVILALAALGVAIYEVVTHWQDICTWVEKAWNWLTKWNDTEVADKHLDVSMNTTSDGMRAGRNALGTSYWGGGETWVGEHGPEKVTLPKGSRVQNHQSSVNSGSGSISIAKLADMIIVREEADIDKIANALALKIKATALNMA